MQPEDTEKPGHEESSPESIYRYESARRLAGMAFFYFGVLAACGLAVFAYHELLTPPVPGAPTQQFTVAKDANFNDVPGQLARSGFVRSDWEFRLAASLEGLTKVTPGGYIISRGMDVFAIVSVLKQPPALVWVTIPEGYRKEQVANILQTALGWTDIQAKEWLTVDTASPPEDVEGVYFPDTYLIPRTESTADVTKRIIAHFNDVFAPYAAEALQKDEKWTTVLTFASLLTREAGPRDMPLIAGILWNRLDKNMPLQVDATLQYVSGQAPNGVWWAPATASEKKLVSPYNTYLNKGLPPHPIAEPGLEAIEAVLNPATTTCLYYLHDNNGIMHCSPTYAGHLANIRRYLK